MAIDCSPQGLATAAQQFECCIPDGAHLAVQTYLLAQIANALAGTSTDPKVLANLATCFRCLDGNQASVQTFLLCAITTALGG